MNNKTLLFILSLSSTLAFSYSSETKVPNHQRSIIQKDFTKKPKETLKNLLSVVKNKKSTDEWNWLAITSIAQLTGKKSIPLLKKYLTHKNWNIRLAALKSLTRLKYKDRAIYAAMLRDKSMLVRHAALESIEHLKMKGLSPNIWNMFRDKQNYINNGKSWKRAEILTQALHTLGQFKDQKVKLRLYKMLKMNKYEDFWDDVDSIFSRWSGKKAPGSNILARRQFWLTQKNSF